MICLYFSGIVLSVLLALILKNTAFRGNPVPFVMELPNYRIPSPKSVALLLWEKAKDSFSAHSLSYLSRQLSYGSFRALILASTPLRTAQTVCSPL